MGSSTVSSLGRGAVRPELPQWVKVRVAPDALARTVAVLEETGVATVCAEAACPNLGTCFSRRTATLLILGGLCTRRCRFCAVGKGSPEPPDAREPARVTRAAARLGLEHLILTSVTRDDLPDGGAFHFAKTARRVRTVLPTATLELLVPDFAGSSRTLEMVLAAEPATVAHNVETVPRLYRHVRPGAEYSRSLRLLQSAKESCPSITVKSGLMLGLGETDAEVLTVMADLRSAGCDFVTIGQYLSPGPRFLPVESYVTPEQFDVYGAVGRGMGFSQVLAGPLVRSSFQSVDQQGGHHEQPSWPDSGHHRGL